MGVLIYALAAFGVFMAVCCIGGALLVAYEALFGYGRPGDGSLDRAFSATDRLHAEAQQAIRDLQDLGNRRES